MATNRQTAMKERRRAELATGGITSTGACIQVLAEDGKTAVLAVHGGHMHSPAVEIAKAINAALKPGEPPLRSFVQKKRGRPRAQVERLVRDDGLLCSNRFNHWRIEDVVSQGGEQGRRYLQWMLDTNKREGGGLIPEKWARKILIVLAATKPKAD